MTDSSSTPPPWESGTPAVIPADIGVSGPVGEPPGPSFLQSLWPDWTGALFSPRVFFQEVRTRISVRRAFGFAIVMTILGSVLSLPGSILRMDETLRMMNDSRFGSFGHFLSSELMRPWLARWPYVYHGGSILLAPIFVPLLYFSLAVGFIHPMSRLLGGKGTFKQTLLALTYTAAAEPMLVLGLIPFAGYLVYLITRSVMTIIGIREAHQFSNGQAAVSLLLGGVILPLLLMIGIPALIFFLLFSGQEIPHPFWQDVQAA